MSVSPHWPPRPRRPPAHDPPYDDDQDSSQWSPSAPLPGQLPLDLDRPRRGRTRPPEAARGGARTRRPSPPSSAATPARTVAVRFVHTCLEVLNGLRPASHLRALARPLEAAAVVATMTHATRRLRRVVRQGTTDHRELIKLRRIRTCQPQPEVIEIAAVIGTGRRAWAAAFRLERRHGRWQCTAATIP